MSKPQSRRGGIRNRRLVVIRVRGNEPQPRVAEPQSWRGGSHSCGLEQVLVRGATPAVMGHHIQFEPGVWQPLQRLKSEGMDKGREGEKSDDESSEGELHEGEMSE